VRNASVLAKQDFRQALSPGGIIEKTHHEKIERLQSLEDAQQYAEAMSAQVTEEVFSKWRAVCGHFQQHCLKLLGPFLTDLEKAGPAGDGTAEGLGLVAASASEVTADRFARFKAAWSDFAVVGAAGGLGATVLSSVLAIWFPPLAVVTLGAAIW